MPVAVSYPGVYLEEIASGVHTIVGVSTSVGAFVGAAKRGPIGNAEHIFSFSDYERQFGGLDQASELSYAVRQFFLNGGNEAWVVRVGANATRAGKALANTTPVNVLDLTAALDGVAGNAIQVAVDYNTSVPASTFNLTLTYPSLDDPQNAILERFANLSMSPNDGGYALTVVNTQSNLITLAIDVAAPIAQPATSNSGRLADADILASVPADPAALPRSIGISLNGDPLVIVNFDKTVKALTDVSNAITAAMVAKVGLGSAYANFKCAAVSGVQCQITPVVNVTNGDSIRIVAGPTNDVSGTFKLGSINGGSEADSFSVRRPAQIPVSGFVAGGELVSDDISAAKGGKAGGTFTLQLDADPTAHTITLTDHTGLNNFRGQLNAIAQEIQKAVRQLPQDPVAAIPVAVAAAYTQFTVTVSRANQLIMTSGSLGAASAVKVGVGAVKDVSVFLKIDTTPLAGALVTLAGGAETPPPWTDTELVNAYLGSTRADGLGIYAFEAATREVVDFNLLCLPGVVNAAVTAAAAALCQERRAFYIADPPQGVSSDTMVSYMTGTAVPKSEYGAIYYPYVRIADPLAGGAPRSCPPSGTLAGVYARTDGSRGVWKAPAGITDGILTGVIGLDTVLSDPQNGNLNPVGVNALRLFPVFGAVAWGARTFLGADAATSDYKYTPVRRLALFIESSLYRGTQWVVFEPNDEPLWSQIRLNVGAFMQDLFRKGAFQGQTPRQAYFVKCDSETTTQNDINSGVVNIVIGFAPLKPAEFVVIQLQQIAGQLGA